jgi:hypothetical protein
MEVEKLFRPSKWFVGFCGLLVIVWLGLQYVANMRLEDEARNIAAQILNWSWPRYNYQSQAEITGARVVRKSDTDAIVEVKGRQKLFDGSQPETVDCNVKLLLYKASNNWVLGRVEQQ